MKIFFSLVLFTFLSINLIAQEYTWELKLSGGGRGNPLAVDPNNNNLVYYGSSNQLYRSINKGDSFGSFGTQIPNSSAVKTVVISSYNSSIIVVACYSSAGNYKIVKSTDSGLSWTTTASNLDFSFYGIPLAQDPSHPDSLYFMNSTAMMRSTDFGSTWTQVSTVPIQGPPCDIEVVKDTSIILVGDNFVGIVRSTDYGQTWQAVYSTSGEIPTISADPRRNNIAFATKFAGGGGILKSTNYGATWNLIGFGGISTWGVHIDPNNSDYVVSGTWSGSNVYISHDGGSTWKTTSLPASNYSVLVIDTMNVFSAQSGGVYKLDSPYFVPVELTSFSAKIINNKAVLDWTTASEINNQGFDVEFSSDNQNFEKIAFIPGFGTSSEQHSYSYTSENLLSPKNYFRLRQIDFNGTFEYSNVVELNGVIPSEFYLSQNHPNPFNPSTSIQFSLPVDAAVKVSLFNMLGEEITEITNKDFSAGVHTINFIAEGLSSGTYLYLLEAKGSNGNSFTQTKKMLLLK